jgi:hypothetical protein
MAEDREGQPREKYNVERDMERFLVRRQGDIAKGAPTDEDMRQQGGLVLSPRAVVLLNHYSESHSDLARWAPLVGQQRMLELTADATNCTRRLLEYLVPLEEVALLGFTHEPWDVPAEAIGLAAASLENMAAMFDGQPDLSEATLQGIETYRYLAARLRVLEERIRRIPGQLGRDTVVLPEPPGSSIISLG